MSWHVICLTMRQINWTCVLIRSGKVLLTERIHSGDKTASSLLHLPASLSVDLDDSHNNAEADETFILLAAYSAFLRHSQNTDIYIKHTHKKYTWCSIYLDSYHRHCIVSLVHVHFPTNPHLVITLLETHKKFPFQSNQFMCLCRSGVDVLMCR